MKYKYFKQPDKMDCGPTCLRMVAKHYGRNCSLQSLRDLTEIGKEGVNLLGIADAAEKIGFRATGVKINRDQLKEAALPVILHWNQNHFVVLYEIKRGQYTVADPSKGLIKYSGQEFCEQWYSYKNNGSSHGIALLLEPTPDFYSDENEAESRAGLADFIAYLSQHKKLLFQLVLGLLIGSILQLILPFLTQSIVDTGINTQNLNFIYIILIAQFMLLLGRTSVDFIRSWILLHISTRLNVSILSGFLVKLMKLPISFFDSKMIGDIMQRMSDQKRIESFLTNQSLTVLFSIFNLIVFSFVLAFFKVEVFVIFLIASFLYTAWILLFMRKRKQLDHKRFDISAKNQSTVIQLIQGMQDIKLSGSEQQKRWHWERIQAKLFKYSIKSLSLGQYQTAGSFVINETKNILIVFLVAKAVISGQMTLGEMVAVQYILGQLNSPVEQLLGFAQSYQDASISMERLNEIYEIENEEPPGKAFLHELPVSKTLTVNNLSFKYPGAGNDPVLRHINLEIPEGKTTAIVGMSGSGKTTLLKLLLGFYKPDSGEIKVSGTAIDSIRPVNWRKSCGVVMQDGFIFSDTIAANIAVADERPDMNKLWRAIETANIQDFVNSLPMGVFTKIGSEGNGISQGQRQRILIARAVYKQPEYILFDEATNALDANNERVIMQNLDQFFRGRTVVVVAHRLSTVKNADHIVVLDKGEIIESGTHESLSCLRGHYFELVRNQLEMGA